MSDSPPQPDTAQIPSRDVSPSPQGITTNAQVRSQAVAMLKRAASLPRTPAGRRPTPFDTDSPSTVTDPANDHDQPSPVDLVTPSRSSAQTTSNYHHDAEEVLRASPVYGATGQMGHYAEYTSNPPSAFAMQKSASASSSFHMPSPAGGMSFSPAASPYYGHPSSGTPDWAAMQLAQSFLPSLSPGGLHDPSFPSPNAQPAFGRSTPSPLPTLGELRTLQRSNSAMARAHAMNKLTGGSGPARSGASSEHDQPGVSGPVSLQRADTLGGAMMLNRSGPAPEEKQVEPEDDTFAVSRPRLQRSFTVSGSNMGEERRSAVGRRMVARLGERRAARQKEEAEVRQLWEERRAAAELKAAENPEDEEEDYDETQEHDLSAYEHDERDEWEDGQPQIPVVNRTSPATRSLLGDPEERHGLLGEGLAVPTNLERPISGTTMRSEAFEYDELRRSLSSRTARKEMGVVEQAMPIKERGPSVASNHLESNLFEEVYVDSNSYGANETPLPLPRPAFATPSRHVANASTSTDGTIQEYSPGDSIVSRDALGSMMFVMGGNSTAPGHGRVSENFPSEVGDNTGSEWGTPGRERNQEHAVTNDQADHEFGSDHNEGNMPAAWTPRLTDEYYGEGTSSDRSQRASVMSWEDVGGPDDRAMLADAQHNQQSSGVTGAFTKNIRKVMRDRSRSRSLAGSSNEGGQSSPDPPDPNLERRESESSQTSGSKSHTRASGTLAPGSQITHKPSLTSLSPSLPSQTESSANSILLQHQLSAESTPVGWLPRADLSDPRIHSSKLSPFPGIVNLEKKLDSASEVPKLVHQLSDSAVPTQQRTTGEAPTESGDSIYSLPLPQPTSKDGRRASGDSVAKRNWLAKAFGHTTSPRGSVSRHARQQSSNGSYATPNMSVENSPTPDQDPFAGPAGPMIMPTRRRSTSPNIPAVPEVNEQVPSAIGSTAHPRVDHDAPTTSEAAAENRELPPKSKEILLRMNNLLSMGPDDPARPDILDDPPRKLVLATQVLQVVNVNTAKDRFLFLFNDLLVITKPILNQELGATLDMRFLVKSIVPLDKLQATGFESESSTEPPRHAVVQSFIEQFAKNPVDACRYLVERSNPRVDPLTLASLIFKTSELDRAQIGVLLSGNEKLMRGFIDRFHLSGVRIDDALRMFLLALRLPTEAIAAEKLLRGFARRYFEANKDVISYTKELAEDLVLWIMQLNDAMYGMYGFALPNPAITLEVVISAFKSKDPQGLVHPSLLSDIYGAIRGLRIKQALKTEEEDKYGRTVTLTPSKMPSKLTYDVWSEWVTVSIPEPDDRFHIRLLGEGMKFEPDVLSFARETQQRFRVKGLSLGTKSVVCERLGPNAALYASLGNGRTFTVERAFMRHTFHVAFTSHMGLRRKYCFSVPDAVTKSKWAGNLQRQIVMTTNAKRKGGTSTRDIMRQAAEVVSVQVLRDALIPPEEKGEGSNLQPNGQTTQRRGSVSTTYHRLQGRQEEKLGPLVPGRPGARTEQSYGMIDVKNGKELVLLCRQNSLLPGVLELLQAGLPMNGEDIGEEGLEALKETSSASWQNGVDGGCVERAASRRGFMV